MNEPAEALSLGAFTSLLPQLELVPGGWAIVGGSIRDLLTGRSVRDIDLVVPDLSVAHEFAERAGGKTVTLGREISTVRVIVDSVVTDFAPMQGATLEADLSRRDFTFNAIALTSRGEVIDPHHGIRDCRERLVRMIAPENLEEDPLRILRAARFSATLRFEIDDETIHACREKRERLLTVAPERIASELRIAIVEGNASILFDRMSEIGLDEILFGFRVGPAADEDGPIAIAALLVERGEEEVERVLETIQPGKSVLKHLPGAVRIVEAGVGDLGKLLAVVLREGKDAASIAAGAAKGLGRLRLARVVESVLTDEAFFDTKPLVDGMEVAEAAGLEAGPELGRLIEELLRRQLGGDLETREEALDWAGRHHLDEE